MAEIAVRASSSEQTHPIIDIHTTYNLPTAGPNQILIGFLASPIHPLDLLVLADKYPIKPQFTHTGHPIPGYDGIAQVLSVGAAVTTFAVGDFVIPSTFGLGTWRSHAFIDPSQVIKITPPQDIIAASMLRLAVAPAYFLVEDVVPLKPGDCIIINAGTSAVAHFVGQFARLRGVGVVHVVRGQGRDGGEMEEVRKRLCEAGAEAVMTEEELIASNMKGTGTRDRNRGRRIVLAIDAVFGGPGSVALRGALCEGGTYVQLGFLSGSDAKVEMGPGELFGRRLTMVGFRGSDRWAARTSEERSSLVNWWVDLFNRGILSRPALGLDVVQWALGGDEHVRNRVRDAVHRAQTGGVGQRKQVLVFVNSEVKEDLE